MPPHGARRAQIGVRLCLTPVNLGASAVLVYAGHLARLLSAAAEAAGREQAHAFRVEALVCDASYVPVALAEFSPLLATLLSHSIPLSMASLCPRGVTAKALVALSSRGVMPTYATEMSVLIDQETLENAAIFNAFCLLLETQCPRLKRLALKAPSAQEFSIVRKARRLMLRCNSTIVSVEIERRQKGDSDDDGENEDGVEYDSDDDLELLGVSQDLVGAMINEMIAAAKGKTAIPDGEFLPDVVILPSLRLRIAFLSALASRDVHLPPSLLSQILSMAGRLALRTSY
ncbi:hypothetical protein ATCC90586_005474 [Pythium insidiosum]|nr:hypothetical protein ATCC90586_005474 [Pythium insidiosum]